MKAVNLEAARRVLIYGYGREGRSTHAFLQKYFPRLALDIHDRAQPEYNTPPLFEEYDVIFVSPGVHRKNITGARPEALTSQTEYFFAHLPEALRPRVIGVTGTKGKSTTVKFLEACLRHDGKNVVCAGNIGVPLLSVWDNLLSGELDFVVAELSSFQLEYLADPPAVSLFLNLYPDHLDRHGDMAHYAAAKGNIFPRPRTVSGLDEDKNTQSGTSEALHDCVHTLPGNMLFTTPQAVTAFTKATGSPFPQDAVIVESPLPEEIFPPESIFRARHWRENFSVAASCARSLGVEEEIITQAAQTLTPLPHRMECFSEKHGITFCNDAIATNPDATLAAIRFFGERLGSIILGGQDRGLDYGELFRVLADMPGVHVLLLESGVAPRMQDMADAQGVRVIPVRDIAQAVMFCAQKTQTGKVCLLSTAAPSFGLFPNFEVKGDAFKSLVYDLPA